MKLWDKGYSTDAFVEEFTVGRDRELDLYLAEADVLGNMAHMKMLNSIGLLSDADKTALEQGLKEIYASVHRRWCRGCPFAGGVHLDREVWRCG